MGNLVLALQLITVRLQMHSVGYCTLHCTALYKCPKNPWTADISSWFVFVAYASPKVCLKGLNDAMRQPYDVCSPKGRGYFITLEDAPTIQYCSRCTVQFCTVRYEDVPYRISVKLIRWTEMCIVLITSDSPCWSGISGLSLPHPHCGSRPFVQRLTLHGIRANGSWFYFPQVNSF